MNTRARISILSELLAFPNFEWDGFSQSHTQKGDLVSLCAAPETKWYVSWVVDFDYNGIGGSRRFLLESIEDGALCWWDNVGINVYSRERVAARPEWRWTDKQFALTSRWNKVLRRADAYAVPGLRPKFDGDSVTFDVRTRFNTSPDFSYPRTFDNWKKVTMKMMAEYYQDAVREYDDFMEKKRQSRGVNA